MRKCLRCGTTMEENLRIEVQRDGGRLDLITRSSIFFKSVGIPKAAVCPSCGEVSLYVDFIREEKGRHVYVKKRCPEPESSKDVPEQLKVEKRSW